jgi:CheY-like chemotaxis protein
MAARTHRATIIEPALSAGSCSRGRRTRRLRVLLVEPEAHLQATLGGALAEAGFEVVVVPSAEDARAELAATEVVPHLFVIETELDGVDGFGLCSQLRADVRTATVPVMLTTLNPEPFHAELAHTVGADDFLPRPVRVADVVALARLKAGRRSGELSYEAHSARLPLPQIARALLAGSRSGRLVLKDCEGFFAFRGGRVVDAGFQGERGVVALRRLLAFGSGVYSVAYGSELHRGSLLMDKAFLCEQVLPALERFERLREVGVPLAARLAVEFPKLAESLPSLPEDVIGLVRLFDGRRTVRAVLEECRFTEVVAFEAITRLFALGVLVPACHVEEREQRVEEMSRYLQEAEAWRVALVTEEREAEEHAAEAHEAQQLQAAEEPRAEVAQVAQAQSESAPAAPEVARVPDEAPVAEPRLEEILLQPLAAILSFPKPVVRRWEERSKARAGGVFHLASGAASASSRTADKV